MLRTSCTVVFMLPSASAPLPYTVSNDTRSALYILAAESVNGAYIGSRETFRTVPGLKDASVCRIPLEEGRRECTIETSNGSLFVDDANERLSTGRAVRRLSLRIDGDSCHRGHPEGNRRATLASFRCAGDKKEPACLFPRSRCLTPAPRTSLHIRDFRSGS